MNEAVDSVLGLSIRKAPLVIDFPEQQVKESMVTEPVTQVPDQGSEEPLPRYRIDLYVNQESRPLWINQGEDVEARARSWCLDQGTDDPQHIEYVMDMIRQTMKEQDLRQELAQFQDRVEKPLHVLLHLDHNQFPEEEVFRFNASERYPAVCGNHME